ncbi:MAG: type II toxin-antitoxin system PemK/MazF family toxin [Patescibacteria group bacterium]|mgnify:CR=1
MKDFDGWSGQKKRINDRRGPFCHAREVWWCALGVNVGFEQDGTDADFRRPVLVLRVFSAQTALVVPLTTSISEHLFRLSIGVIDGKEAHALLSQVRVIDTKRLIRKVVRIEKSLFETIRKAVKGVL